MNISHITGLNQLLSENRIQDLMLMYQLFSRVRDGLKELATAFASYIKVSVGTFIFNTGPKGHLKYCHFTFLAHLAFRPGELLSSLFVRLSSVRQHFTF